MSKIDMRLTVEEAAKDYAIGKTFFSQECPQRGGCG